MIIAFLLFTGLYFILNTFFVYSVCGVLSCTNAIQDVFFLLRDLLWIALIVIIVVKNIRLLLKFILENRYILLTFLFIILGNFVVSWMNGISTLGIVVGFKYAYFHLYIFLTAGLLGFFLSKQSVDTVFKKFFILFCIILLIGFVLDIFKYVSSEFFMKYLGFGPVGDYILGHNPPVYYRTGPGGIMRLSGLWAGPNNYGFLLIGLTPLFVANTGSKLRQRLLVGIVGLGTLSRALIVGWVSELILHSYLIRKKLSRLFIGILVGVIGVGIVGVSYLSFFKSTSTGLHVSRRYEAFMSAIHYPFGVGLGQSGPAVHWGGKLLPENFYLQLSIEGGIAMLFFYCLFWYLIYNRSNFEGKEGYLYWLWIGFVGMSVAGMFLHVFEDSMTNYWFFVLFGLAWGNNLQKK